MNLVTFSSSLTSCVITDTILKMFALREFLNESPLRPEWERSLCKNNCDDSGTGILLWDINNSMATSMERVTLTGKREDYISLISQLRKSIKIDQLTVFGKMNSITLITVCGFRSYLSCIYISYFTP